MRFSIRTLGCKVNAYESEYYAQTLQERGHIQDDEQFDCCIINTCTVTNTAAAKSRQMIHRAKKSNPDAKIVVVGCYSETAGQAEKDAWQADLIIGAKGKSMLADKIDTLFQNGPNLAGPVPEGFENMPLKSFSHRHRAFLKVQDGCEQFCSYCAIPYARGPERSLEPEQVLDNARMLADAGHLEIVLTGIHTGKYHSKGKNLADLLALLLDNVDEKVCFRISSIEITEVSDALVRLIRDNPRMQPHLHIPIQSGCDAVLQRMNRPYTIREFEDRLNAIRQAVPGISISTDVITGFPQETEEEHQTTLETLERLGFSFLHVFPYSLREGTAAASMPDHVAADVKKARVHDLLTLSNRLRLQDMDRFAEAVVLVEKGKDGYHTGYTGQYHPVRIVTGEKNIPARVKGPVKRQGDLYVMEEFDAAVEDF